jgi:hypothetical protein
VRKIDLGGERSDFWVSVVFIHLETTVSESEVVDFLVRLFDLTDWTEVEDRETEKDLP